VVSIVEPLHALGLRLLGFRRLGSLRRTLACYRDFSNHHRPHQGIGNQIPDRLATGGLPVLPAALTAQRLAVAREQFLGGLLNSYYRKAA